MRKRAFSAVLYTQHSVNGLSQEEVSEIMTCDVVLVETKVRQLF
jgi:DNA-directed RNA polymerase specialized sigma24 family protein